MAYKVVLLIAFQVRARLTMPGSAPSCLGAWPDILLHDAIGPSRLDSNDGCRQVRRADVLAACPPSFNATPATERDGLMTAFMSTDPANRLPFGVGVSLRLVAGL